MLQKLNPTRKAAKALNREAPGTEPTLNPKPTLNLVTSNPKPTCSGGGAGSPSSAKPFGGRRLRGLDPMSEPQGYCYCCYRLLLLLLLLLLLFLFLILLKGLGGTIRAAIIGFTLSQLGQSRVYWA